MDIYARVNILGGEAVRLPTGDVSHAIALDADPIARAESRIMAGADHIHVVDLDAAVFGDYSNRPLIAELIQAVDAPVQVAGGIRTEKEADRIAEMGAWRMVIGTSAVEDQVLVWDLCRTHPDRMVVSFDVRHDGEVAIRGWTVDSGVYLEEMALEFSSAGVAGFLIAEAGRDALASRTDLSILRRALSLIGEPVVAAGGATDIDDLAAIAELEESGRKISGIIFGREITEGRFTLQEAATLVGA